MRQPLSPAAPEPIAGGVVALRAVSRVYRPRGGQMAARREVTVAFAAGTFTAIMGPSGISWADRVVFAQRTIPCHLSGE